MSNSKLSKEPSQRDSVTTDESRMMHAVELDFAKYDRLLQQINTIAINGKVAEIRGLMVEGYGAQVSIGDVCFIYPNGKEKFITAEVVGFRAGKVLMMPLENMQGLGPGCKIKFMGRKAYAMVGRGFLGRVVDGLGNPLDNKGFVASEDEYPIYAESINPMFRSRIAAPMDMGIRSLNALFACGKGQRMGVFSGSGVGKSVIMGMIAQNSKADVNVIGLIGERGREVREFIEKNLGSKGLAKSVVVVAASDMHPLIRMRAAYVATTIAEYFRDQGADVLLMMDSLTRFAMAQREVGLAVGEPPATKGYTPSIFSILPKLLERCGIIEGKGSITGLYTVLVEGDDFNEPIADASRSILDGHITLSRDLANKNHYPAIDPLQSISRTMVDIVSDDHRKSAGRVLDILATYKKAEDLINIGAYAKGSNPEIDYAISMVGKINVFLKQDINEAVDFDRAKKELFALFEPVSANAR
jgi:flagellum-specific ATP synthase